MKGPYATSASLIVLAPLFVGAGDYLLISRLCLRVLPAHHTHIFRIPVRKLTLIFVLCDILTLLVQCSGTSIAASNDWVGETVQIGENVLIAGLAMQLATFSFFLAIVAKFHMLTLGGEGVSDTAGDGWKRVLMAVYISSSMIIVSRPSAVDKIKYKQVHRRRTDIVNQVRCIYRLIEFALGVFGYPFTHEWMFYVFEAIPMLPAIFIFSIWHPGMYFGAGSGRIRNEQKTGEIPLENTDRLHV